MKNTISHGNCDYVVTGKEYVYNRNQDTGNTLSITYEVPEEQSQRGLPALGGGTALMRGVVLDRISVTPSTAGMAVVRLEYAKAATDEDEEDEDDDDDDDDDEGKIVEQTLEGSVSDEPLLSHPKCTGISDAQFEYLKAVQDGARLWEKVTELNEDGSPKLDKNGSPVKKTLKQLIKDLGDNGKVVYGFIKKGIQSYRSPGATWREKRLAKSGEVSIDGLGKIGSPSGAPTPAGRNWLMIGKTLSKNSDGKTWSIETVYELSGPNGWDKTLYS